MAKQSYNDTSLLSPAPIRNKIEAPISALHNLGPTGPSSIYGAATGDSHYKIAKEVSARRLF